jgi:hypothetical protein
MNISSSVKLKYFLLILLLIFGIFLIFTEIHALAIAPTEKGEKEIEEKVPTPTEEFQTPTEKLATPTIEKLPGKKGFFERNKIIILAVVMIIIIGIVVYLFRKKHK